MKIGFYLREINFRGIANSIYLFAINNERLLKNSSVIIYNSTALDNQKEAIQKFKKKFKTFKIKNFEELNILNKKIKLDFIYFQRDGAKDKLVENCKNLIHAVFPQNLFQSHGYSYAYISKWLSKKCSNLKIPFSTLPVNLSKSKKDLRKKLKIPKNAKVFGYHGGENSFDLQFVKNLIKEISSKEKNIFFLFMNIKKFISNKQVIFLKGSFDQKIKKEFINSCDAMLHARSLGESFGISCAEFAICNKPIITYGFCRQRAHFDICKKNIITYFSYNDLQKKLLQFNKKKIYKIPKLATNLSGETTIQLFKKVFLDKNYKKKSINYIDYIMVLIFSLQKNYYYFRHKLYTNFYNLNFFQIK